MSDTGSTPQKPDAPATLPAFPRGSYLSLTTFRRDGREVATPLWFVEIGGTLYVYTRAESAKVRRLKNNPAARIAPCTMRGQITGLVMDGTAREIGDPQRIREVYAAMAAKYRLSYRIGTLLAWLTSGIKKRAVLEIMPEIVPGRSD